MPLLLHTVISTPIYFPVIIHVQDSRSRQQPSGMPNKVIWIPRLEKKDRFRNSLYLLGVYFFEGGRNILRLEYTY